MMSSYQYFDRKNQEWVDRYSFSTVALGMSNNEPITFEFRAPTLDKLKEETNRGLGEFLDQIRDPL